MKRINIHKEGHFILSGLLLLIFCINVVIYLEFPVTVVAINTILSALVLCFFTFFFRSPNRIFEINDPSLVVAPADGTVVVIEPTLETEYFGDERMQISIFMSILNVHANWYPVSGKVIKTSHRGGRHLAAYLPKSSKENEQASIVIETPLKTQILVRQVAGTLAQRIVTYAYPGKECHINEHLGFIKFGSRVDLFLPLDSEIFVKVGEKTTGNETIIARLKENKDDNQGSSTTS